MIRQFSQQGQQFCDGLPKAFEFALRQIEHGNEFTNAAAFAARQIGCELLFEVPGLLFDPTGVRAVVFRDIEQFSGAGEINLTFIVFDGDERIIRILEAHEVPKSVLQLANSYSVFLEQASKIFPRHGATLQ